MDKYTKLAKIGKGSFGCAYLVTRKSDPQAKKYVIKEIRMDPRDQQSALREAKLLSALDHPNIIACKESFLVPPPAGGAQQVLCIVTEYADGGDLRKKLEQQIARHARLKEQEILDLFVQICLALKHLHDRKIIHRDIKPENIFLMQSNVVKLGDFGVATVLSNTLACAETMTGTPYYTSPEICMGKRYNHKTDIWSLGCVLYELATFAHAFNGRSQRQLFENIMNASFTPIASSVTGGGASGLYSKRLSELVTEMLMKNPRDRPSVNQIIKKPIVMERIQGFLSERALADELNHTVLHGHHIFQRNAKPAVVKAAPRADVKGAAIAQAAKSPAPSTAAANVIRRAEVVFAEKKKAVAAPSSIENQKAPTHKKRVAGKSAHVVLRKSGSLKKPIPVSSPSPARSPAIVKKKAVSDSRSGAAAAPTPRYLTPTKALEQKNRLLLQKKKAIVEKARQEALRAAGSKPSAAATPSEVSDRISAFNAQWQVQRQQLLNNLPPPAPTAAATSVLPPPPPQIAAEPKRVESPHYPKPVVTASPFEANQAFVPPAAPVSAPKARNAGAALVKAAAAKQRDAMRKDIRNRKLEMKKAAPGVGGVGAGVKSGGSPLDDPVILVQNLPDYERMEPPPSSASSAANSEASTAGLLLPPPPPVSDVVPASLTPVDSAADVRDAGDAEGDDECENDEVGGDEAQPEAPVNLEFERMVLQLKSVVELSDLDDDLSDNDEDLDADNAAGAPFGNRILEESEDDLATASSMSASPASPSLPPAYGDHSSAALSVSVLEEPDFKKALRALLSVKVPSGDESSASESTASVTESVRPEQKQSLLWMHNYISALLSNP